MVKGGEREHLVWCSTLFGQGCVESTIRRPLTCAATVRAQARAMRAALPFQKAERNKQMQSCYNRAMKEVEDWMCAKCCGAGVLAIHKAIRNDQPCHECGGTGFKERVALQIIVHQDNPPDPTGWHKLQTPNAPTQPVGQPDETLVAENAKLRQELEKHKIVVSAILDVYDVVLPYKVLKRCRELIGRK